jgi:hypothetical protein
MSKSAKTYTEFCASSYYLAFVKFGRHCVELRCVNVVSFIDWLLKNNRKLDHWCKDSLYAEWLLPHMQREAVQDALERALKEMTGYAQDHPELKNGFSEYFKFGNANRICYHIATGRISPWVVFNCDTGAQFLGNLDESQVEQILPWIDPGIWQKKFQDHAEDVSWVKQVLLAAQL